MMMSLVKTCEGWLASRSRSWNSVTVTAIRASSQRASHDIGSSRSRPWLTLKARAAAPVPVARVTVPDAVARGAALAAGVAAGWWPTLAAAPPAPLEPVELMAG